MQVTGHKAIRAALISRLLSWPDPDQIIMSLQRCWSTLQSRNQALSSPLAHRSLPAAVGRSRGKTRCRCHEQQKQQQCDVPQQQEQHHHHLQQQQPDPGLVAFAALIAEKRFFCTQCGKCCTGDGEVWIADEEAGRIAGHLGLPLQRFYQQYTQGYSKVEGFRLLKAKDNPVGGSPWDLLNCILRGSM